jgi:hypothetical protein
MPARTLDVHRDLAEAVARDATATEADGSVTGISPFEVPTSITLQIQQKQVLDVRLTYPNSDPPASTSFRARADGKTTVSVGRHSGRVFHLAVNRPQDALRQPDFAFIEPSCVQEYIEALHLPHWERESALRNARLVSEIVHRMDESTRSMILGFFDAVDP